MTDPIDVTQNEDIKRSKVKQVLMLVDVTRLRSAISKPSGLTPSGETVRKENGCGSPLQAVGGDEDSQSFKVLSYW